MLPGPRYESSGSRRRRPSIHEAAVMHGRCERPSPWFSGLCAVACSLRQQLARTSTECCNPSCLLYLALPGPLLIPSVSRFVPGASFSVFLVGVLGCSFLRYSNAMSPIEIALCSSGALDQCLIECVRWVQPPLLHSVPACSRPALVVYFFIVGSSCG